MTRVHALVLLAAAAGCYSQASTHPVPAAIVNDACGANASEATCAASAGCEWRAVKSECPAGTTCPAGACITPDPCAALTDQAQCQADTRCAWSGVRLESASIDLCPVGQSCDSGGYCHTRDASGGGCTCVQPLACPANADCPAVQCDCSNPPPGGGGGGTCTCTCPACAPGEACSPCSCECGGGGGGSCVGDSGGGGTCICACPTCAPGTTCPPCDCACGAGSVGAGGNSSTGTTTTMVGGGTPPGAATDPGTGCVCPTCPAGTACLPCDCPVPPPPVDPCAGHGDANSCLADGANACSWIELGIVCITAPCPSGACVQVKPVPGDVGGCGCACPACIAGQSCPPCACDCCGTTKTPITGNVPVPEPVPPPA